MKSKLEKNVKLFSINMSNLLITNYTPMFIVLQRLDYEKKETQLSNPI